MKLLPRIVEKPWGRTDLPPNCGGASSSPIGEIWFEHPDGQDLPLLVKYIFTSEKLSIQVHPSDAEAHERGLPRGKSECWYILSADEGASLGLGLRSAISANELRSASMDGSIEQLMDWRPVKAGDFVYVPARTIHAIGAGITLLEVQQNSDVTYRLYDYGRPRELHLDEGMAVADLHEYDSAYFRPSAEEPIDATLFDGPNFSIFRVSSAERPPPSILAERRWVMTLQGRALSEDATATAGECLLLEPWDPLDLEDSTIILVAIDAPAG